MMKSNVTVLHVMLLINVVYQVYMTLTDNKQTGGGGGGGCH